MMFVIKEVKGEDQKMAVVAEILRDLPEWFGIPESTQAYIEGAKDLQVWAAYQESDLTGFVSLSYSSEECAEIDCLGVKKANQGRGIGSQLLATLESEARRRKGNNNRIHRHIDNRGQDLYQRGRKTDFYNLTHTHPVRFQCKSKRNFRVPLFIDYHSGKAAHKLTDDGCKRSSGCFHSWKAKPAENKDRIENQICQRCGGKCKNKKVRFSACHNKPVKDPLSHLAERRDHTDT